MSRKIAPDKIRELRDLCTVRSNAALASLAAAQSKLSAVESEMEKLYRTSFNATDPTAARALEAWLSWKQEHLERLKFSKAKKKAVCQNRSELAARASAELRVVERLLEKAIKERQSDVQRRLDQTS